MADTARSAADLLTLLADNTSGAISPQDMRDVVTSLRVPQGSLGFEGNAIPTTINTVNVYELVGGTFIAGGVPWGMTESVAGRLTYTGAPDCHLHIVSNLDFICASNNQIVRFKWHLNGVPISRRVRRKVGTGADVGALSIHADAVLSTGDYIELMVANETSTADVTVEDIYNFSVGMFGM